VKFLDEFRSRELAVKLVHELSSLVEPGRTVKIMEVCGGHTHTIYRHGIGDLVPA
jgi:hydrogenase expression/formation protein HypD